MVYKRRILVCGVGINDADYATTPVINGKQKMCPFYRAWHGMLERCYCLNVKNKHPTYLNVSCCEEWNRFSKFKEWMSSQNWQGNCLDKDILSIGNKIYCPEKCIFVSQSVNKILLIRKNSRGEFPLGVNFHRNGYVAECYTKNKKNKKYIGRFKTAKEAHTAWQKAKLEYIEQEASEQIDERIKNALMLRVYNLKYDLENNLETTDL